MTAARKAMCAEDLFDEVEAYVLDHCQRAGDEDAPLPFDKQPADVRAAIALAAALRDKLA